MWPRCLCALDLNPLSFHSGRFRVSGAGIEQFLSPARKHPQIKCPVWFIYSLTVTVMVVFWHWLDEYFKERLSLFLFLFCIWLYSNHFCFNDVYYQKLCVRKTNLAGGSLFVPFMQYLGFVICFYLTQNHIKFLEMCLKVYIISHKALMKVEEIKIIIRSNVRDSTCLCHLFQAQWLLPWA